MKKLLLFCILALSLWANDGYKIEESSDFTFTPQEANSFASVGFRISSGVIKVKNSIGGWANGEYELREANIIPSNTTDTYIADLIFSKKKGVFSFVHSEKIGILYDGAKLWIKYHDRIYRYSVPSPTQTIEKENNRITAQTKPPILDVEFENIRLRFEF